MARTPGSVAALAALLLALGAAACGSVWHERPLPAPVSLDPGTGSGGLLAGFGRADITPPPGVGLGGNGPEGNVATGWRHRLYARALLLEDPGGERLALVVLDQAHVSANLHRIAAESLLADTGIGADRLIVSATHTHSGTSHFYAERQLNGSSSRLEGYDSTMVHFLVNGIVRAVRQARDSLAPARAAWGFARVPGFTRNRSYAKAYCRNPAALRFPCAGEPGGDSPDSLIRSVDHEWKLLRVDRRDGSGRYRPAGAYSVLAIHGTANPSITTLLDGDIHAVVERRLERLIDSANGKPGGFANEAVHVMANGTEGDVSPDRPDSALCPTPALRSPPFAGPRSPAPPWSWVDADSTVLERCFAAARRWIDDAGTAMGDSVFAAFQRLEGGLTPSFPIRRAFTTLRLSGNGGLCAKPVVGTATAAGASDVATRVAGWKMLGVIPSGIEQGGHAIRKPSGCQAEKRVLLAPIQSAIIVGKHGLPEVAQLSLVRMGDVFLAAVPAEPTTTTGRIIADSVKASSSPDARVIVVSLANGFMQYVTTRHEYAGQTYEGASTIYGPNTAEFFAARFAELARTLPAGAPRSPPAAVLPMTAYPGKSLRLLPDRTATPALTGGRVLLSQACLEGGRRRITWLDEPPGRLAPALGQVLEVSEPRGSVWEPVAWDDQRDVVVEAVGPENGRGFRWSVTIARPALSTGRLRLRLLARGQLPETLHDLKGCTEAEGR
ncbi:MAG: neutral/alkaline non-lysosomal ceramidase N-terminal domain-containing protein [Gemmatimonadales bacterium]